MSYRAKLLGEGEQVVLDLRPHRKQLVLPLLLLLLVLAGYGFLLALVHDGTTLLVAGVMALALVAWWALVPYLRWQNTAFVVTTRRVLVRQGVLARSGRDVPLTRINDVTFQHSLLERMLGCGTLVVESAGERGQVVLADVPRVEQVQRTIYDLAEQAG